jgi:hypothetical protein
MTIDLSALPYSKNSVLMSEIQKYTFFSLCRADVAIDKVLTKIETQQKIYLANNIFLTLRMNTRNSRKLDKIQN